MVTRAITAREQEVLGLIDRGFTNDEIAKELGISARTVKAYTDSLRIKLGVDFKRELPHAARTQGALV